MIIAPTPCFYMLKAEGEAAHFIAESISPSTCLDIVSAIIVSQDFDNDLMAVNCLTSSIEQIRKTSKIEGLETEKYNPLYMPGDASRLDEVITFDGAEEIQFIGMNGNPFILKTVEIADENSRSITAKVEYRPFDIPSYGEIVESANSQQLN